MVRRLTIASLLFAVFLLTACRHAPSADVLLLRADTLLLEHDSPRALQCLEKAVDVARHDTTRAMAWNMIGSLYLEQNINDLALKAFRQAYHYDSLLNDTSGLIYDLRDMGNVYRSQALFDSCRVCFDAALRLATLMGDDLMVSDIKGQQAALYLQQDSPQAARPLLMEALKLVDAESESGLYYMAADYYTKVHQTDSAEYYYRQLLDVGTLYTQQAAHAALADISMKKYGDADKALYHLQQYELLTDSVVSLTDIETLRRMSALYDYQHHEREAVRQQLTATRRGQILAIVFALLCLLSAAFVGLFLNSRRRQAVFTLRLNELQRQLADYEQRMANMPEENRNPVPIPFLQQRMAVDTDRPLNKDEWQQLEQQVNEHYPDFTRRLFSFRQLNEQEYHVCLLLKAGAAPAAIALLTAHSKQSVTNSRSRLFEKTFGRKGTTAEWDEFIKTL